MSVKSKVVSGTTTSSGLIAAGLKVANTIVLGAYAVDRRCVPVIGLAGTPATQHWNILVLTTAIDQTALTNTSVEVTVYYMTRY